MRVLGIIFGPIFAILGWSGQVTPDQAMSNYSAWYELITKVEAPAWMESTSADFWGTGIFAMLSIACFLWFFWPRVVSARANFGTVRKTAQPKINPTVKQDRIWVPENVDPSFLSQLYKEHTKVQANQLTKIYIGQWMPVSGLVFDVSKRHDSVAVYINSKPFISMEFGEIWSSKLLGLTRNTPIKVNGQIKELSSGHIELHQCELL